MSELVYDCPRCNAQNVTFDVLAIGAVTLYFGSQHRMESFCICRHCNQSTVVVIHEKSRDVLAGLQRSGGLGSYKGNLNGDFAINGYISLKDNTATEPPEYLPADIEAVFKEGATCMAVGCFNAGGTMFRLCLDMATKSFMPEENDNGLNSKIRRSLGLRLDWLFETGVVPRALQELAACVKEDGNDGAHEGTLTKADAEDLLDFTVALLERLYTEPATLKLAQERRAARRQAAG
jgi:hypothetical protein